MITFACPVALLALLGTLGAQAVNVPLASPAPGSAARQAILNAVRGPVERSFGGQHVMFKVNDLQVGGGWAFLAARPMTPAQRYLSDPRTGAPEVWAILQQQRGGWKVLRWAMPTDVISLAWEQALPQVPGNLWPHHRW
ncbi:hypothetical protein D3875_14655 [Deinococcus cavernae]|uniref:Uncharacterized protein n=1 Tax=Deinococcus cavernae TaxID=2320857 RepID=A0A418V907_9DEIO|nr:hypothetical protein [Deinococcus cavernae]RJF72598.1 hypothetical protein D3875_14655 [Deinococcus cavernae]